MTSTNSITGRRGLFVIGPHRSGTSALARCINYLGLELPKTLMGASDSNPVGHWESTEICKFNELLLNNVCGSWQGIELSELNRLSLTDRNGWSSELCEIISSEFDLEHDFVLKDPRISKLVPLFLRAAESIEVDPHFWIAVRNPLEVAKSLNARNEIPEAIGALIWLSYNLDAEFHTRGVRRNFSHFPELLNNSKQVLTDGFRSLKLATPAESPAIFKRVEAFLDQNLRHHRISEEDILLSPHLRGWISKTYDSLLNLCADPGSESAQRQLDEVRSSYLNAYGMIQALESHYSLNTRLSIEQSNAKISNLNEQGIKAKQTIKQLKEMNLSLTQSLIETQSPKRRGAKVSIAQI